MSPATLARLPRIFAGSAGILVFLIGAMALAGWTFDVAIFRSVVPGWAQMAASSALGFVLAGFALWCGATGPSQAIQVTRGSWRQSLLRGCGAAMAIIGLFKLSEALGGWNLGMEQLWFHGFSGPSGPARMTPTTAVNFVFLGCALALTPETRFISCFQFLCILGAVIGWLGFSHYFYGGEPLMPYGQMPMHTAGAFLALSGGILCLRTDGGIMALLISDSLGGGLARRLVPAVVLLPIFLGWLRLQGQRAGWFGTEAGVSVLALANGVVFGGLIWINATLLHRTDSGRKIAEEELVRLNAELEQRVNERTAELTAANQEMENFTYAVAHDLRAPLRHMAAFSKILDQELSPSPPPTTQRCLNSISRAIGNMTQLVDDLLKLARLARHQLMRRPTPLGPVVEALLTSLKPETAARSVEWRIHPLPTVECDPDLIQQVFANLLSNAIKFSRTRPRAIIELGALLHDDHPVFFVRDNGVGFDMAYADKLFGVFQRLHHVDQFEGTGVGLAAAERIIRRHGGRIWADAALDHGATFYFTLGVQQDLPPGLANADNLPDIIGPQSPA